MSIAIGIVEDDLEVAQHLIEAIQASGSLRMVGHATNRWQAAQLFKKNICDVYLLDIGLPDADGLDLIQDIREVSSEAKIIIVTSYSNSKQILKSFKLGASGYLLKHEATRDLERRIVQAYNGAMPVSPEVSKYLINRIDQLENEKTNSPDMDSFIKQFNLTKSEWRVLQLLVEGLAINTIAIRLNNSPHTINQHLRSIYKKLGVSSRSMAVSIAISSGFRV
jgi:DNA-binding NarL/FixJ family response regulator